MRPEGWSLSRYVRYAAARIMLILYVVCGLLQLGLAFCWLIMGSWDDASHLFKFGSIMMLIALVIAIVEYNLRPEVDAEDEY
jgi:hypothetical protein